MVLTLVLRVLGESRIVEATELHHPYLKAINSKDAPDTVAPGPHPAARIDGATLSARLKPYSWNVIATANP
jgi:alpha-N-arabinofuranosidase